VRLYKVEPYAVAADIYTNPQHAGRGGWTWYTGSASWFFRLMVETLLGLRLEVDRLTFAPRLPAEWKDCKIHYRYRETFYHITLHAGQTGGPNVSRVVLDGTAQTESTVPLVDDRQEHEVEIELQ
jgi:cellobiose phosphorylase